MRKHTEQAIRDYNIETGQYNDTYCYMNMLEKIGSYWYVDFRLAGMDFENRVTRKLGKTLSEATAKIRSWS